MSSMKEFIVDGRYKNLKIIGEGSYGIVAKGIDSVTGTKVAIKKVKQAFNNVVDAKRILRELKLLRHLNNHENIIHLVDVMLFPPTETQMRDIYIVTNLLDSDLEKIIESQQAFTDHHLQFFIYQILRGLKYIHSANILHRDLKPSNILVNGNCEIALCDFGLSRGFDDEFNPLFTQYVATRWYRAPEMLCNNGNYGKPVDIWSVGCVFAELINKYPLFPGKDPQNQLQVIVSKLGVPDKETLRRLITNPTALAVVEACRERCRPAQFESFFPVNTNSQGIDLMRRMLEFDPAARITVEEALNHPFLKTFHKQFREPASESRFDPSYERRDNGIAAMTLEEVRACMFEEASQYRHFGSGEEKSERIDRDDGKDSISQITRWRRAETQQQPSSEAKGGSPGSSDMAEGRDERKNEDEKSTSK